MTPSSRRAPKTFKRKPFKPSLNPRDRLHGHLEWLNHLHAFEQYLQVDTEHLRLQRFNTWMHDGLTQSLPFLDDDSSRPQLALHDPEEPIHVPPAAEAPRYLYALEVSDLLEFTEEDIAAAWGYRTECCGSVEAAAELYALYRLVTGTDDNYAGEAAYLWHPEVVALFPALEEQRPASQVELDDTAVIDRGAGANVYDLQAVRELGIDALRQAWENRPDSFASLEAAAETLAILRALRSESSAKPSYKAMLSHELVQDLVDVLPLENPDAGSASTTSPTSPTRELELLRADRRTVRTLASVVRPGQASFREGLLARYGGQCCISGCNIAALVEAAHIIPYRGDQSDDVSNGLLLRVDMHRLFDAHLVSINPESLEVQVASVIEDPAYRAYHGKRLFQFTPRPRLLFLETHYQAFKKLAQ